METKNDTEQQLKELRKRWLIASPENRKVIEMRAKLLKMRHTQEEDKDLEEKIKIFE